MACYECREVIMAHLPPVIFQTPPVFWRWLAGSIPVALLNQVSVSYGDENKDIATVNFEIKLVMLIGEMMKMCHDKERIESAKLKRTEIDAKESMLA